MDSTPFTELGVSSEIAKSLRRMKFTTPTPVQKLTIAAFLNGEDLLVQAPTGTGKTAAFGMPIIQRLDLSKREPQALILCPTRELALQITGVLRELSSHKQGVRIAAIYGGENIARQFTALGSAPHILVATPGRLMDHMQRKTVKLAEIKTVVLDEADRMLDMGFRRDIERILRATPRERQTVMYSATIPQEIYFIAGEYQKDAKEIRVEQESLAVETAEFDSFAAHLTRDCDFIRENKDLMGHDPDGPMHCLLVTGEGREDGILAQASGYDYARYAAHVPHAHSIIAAQNQSPAMTALGEKLSSFAEYMAGEYLTMLQSDDRAAMYLSGQAIDYDIDISYSETLREAVIEMIGERLEGHNLDMEFDNGDLIVTPRAPEMRMEM